MGNMEHFMDNIEHMLCA